MSKNSLKIILLILLIGLFTASNSSILNRVKKAAILTAQKIRKYGLSLHEAMWYRKLADGSVQCELCPFRCIIKEGERGICGVRANIDGKLRTLVYSRPVAVHIDPIEKKPLFHFLPGTKSFSIATVGCNLSCIFCQNWTISQALPEETPFVVMTPQDVVRKALETGCKSIAYTYSEPSVFYEYMYDTGVLAHKAGLKNVWITCGYINEKPLRQLAKVIDGANVDLKGPESFYIKYTKSSRKTVLNTLKILRQEGVWIEVTNLIIPDANDDPDTIREMCRWLVKNLGPDVPLHFSRFYPNYKLNDRPPTPVKTLHMARQIALEEGIKYVYIGNVPGDAGEDTYCPTDGKKLIDREGYWIVDYKLDSNGCYGKSCCVPGVWK